MSALLDQLRQLREDLVAISDRDPEQEVTGIAVPLVDSVLSEARGLVEAGDSGLAGQIIDLVSVEQIESGDGIRAVDALILVGQLLAALTTLEAQAEAREARAVEADKQLLPAFLELLPPDGAAIRHLRYHQFEMSFEQDTPTPLWRWYDEWTRPSQRFQSARIKPLEEEFRTAVGALYDHSVLHVFTRDDGTRRVYPDHDLDWETPENRYVFDAIREGNELLGKAYQAYERLVHEATLHLT